MNSYIMFPLLHMIHNLLKGKWMPTISSRWKVLVMSLQRSVNWEFSLFRWFQVDIKEISCPFFVVEQTWNHFSHNGVVSVAKNGWVVGFQIETKHIFPLVVILTNLHQCKLQIDKLERLTFVNKKWPNNLRLGCNNPKDTEEVVELEIELACELEEEF